MAQLQKSSVSKKFLKEPSFSEGKEAAASAELSAQIGSCLLQVFGDQIGEVLVKEKPSEGIRMYKANIRGRITDTSALAQIPPGGTAPRSVVVLCISQKGGFVNLLSNHLKATAIANIMDCFLGNTTHASFSMYRSKPKCSKTTCGGSIAMRFEVWGSGLQGVSFVMRATVL